MPSSHLLISALVTVTDVNGKIHVARALLDTCASAHFISEKFARKLKLPMHACSASVNMMDSANSNTNNLITLTFHSLLNNFKKSLTFLTISTIADLVPAERFPRDSIFIPSNCRLADPDFHIPRPVDLLIGSGATLSMVCNYFDVNCVKLSFA